MIHPFWVTNSVEICANLKKILDSANIFKLTDSPTALAKFIKRR